MTELWKNGPLYDGGGAFPITTDSVLLADFVRAKPCRAVELCSGAGLISLLLLSREPRLSIDLSLIHICSHSCADLIELVMSIYAKKQYAESRKRRFTQLAARFMKRAETLLYGELSVALGIPFEEVQPDISSRIASQ